MVAFLIGFAMYAMTKKWLVAVLIPCILFVLISFIGNTEQGFIVFTLTFGVPLVFFAGLLGAYVYQTRVMQDDDELSESVDEFSINQDLNKDD